MASSTTSPIASTSASSVRTLIEKPAAHMMKKAPMSDTGMTRTGMIVVRQSRRKRKITTTTRARAEKIVCCTSAIDLRMNTEVSKP